jgi:type IV pilus assembly protein PilZ
VSSSLSLSNKPGLLTLTIKDKSSLYQSYMPFIVNGALFIPTHNRYNLGEEVFLMLTLPDSPEKFPVAGRVVWITPKNAQGRRVAGIGVQLGNGQDEGVVRRKIEALLAGALDKDRPTYTL